MSSSYGHHGSVPSEKRDCLSTQVIPAKENNPPPRNHEIRQRAHHNQLERQRRDEINASYSSLQQSIPTVNSFNKQASRQEVLNHAIGHIQRMKEGNSSKAKELSELRRRNDEMQQQVRELEASLGKEYSFPDSDASDEDEEDATEHVLQEALEKQADDAAYDAAYACNNN